MDKRQPPLCPTCYQPLPVVERKVDWGANIMIAVTLIIIAGFLARFVL